MKIDATFISEATHPVAFAMHPDLRRHAAVSGGRVLVQASALKDLSRARVRSPQHQVNAVSAPANPGASAIAFADRYFAAKRGTAPRTSAVNAPAAAHPQLSKPLSGEISEEQLTATLAHARALREARRR